MTLEELKREITDKIGIPAALLNGETIEENIAQAKALLAYRRETAQQSKSKAEKFAEWFRATQGIEEPDAARDALNEIEERAKGYITTPDGGNTFINGKDNPDGRSAADQFAEWFAENTAYNPFKGSF